ncbi:MAG: type II secretion system protein [Fimbriimonas sp.]
MMPASKSKPGYRTGFSLIEILVVIVVALLLMAILVPVLVNARTRAFVATDISNMRQLGHAASMYADETGLPPLSPLQLVRAGMCPKEILFSRRDTRQGGRARAISLEIEPTGRKQWDEIKYPVTFAGPMEFTWDMAVYRRHIENQPGAGWLVNLVDCQTKRETDATSCRGRYQRLMFDGSVQNRTQGAIPLLAEDGVLYEDVIHPILFFVDGDAKWISEHGM